MPWVIALRQFYTRDLSDVRIYKTPERAPATSGFYYHRSMRELRKVVLFGASGMIGQGVLRECLLDPQISEVVSIVRSSTGEHDAKVREVSQLSETA